MSLADGSILQGLSDEIAALADRLRLSVVVVRDGGRGGGAGVIWREDGIILTNNHVAPGDRAQVTLADGRTLPARVAAHSAEYDLAALRVEATGLPAAPAGDSRLLRPGELVIAIGHPFGVRDVVTAGIVLARGLPPGFRGPRDAVLTSARLRPGNSGGPLINARGEVVGINAMVLGGDVGAAVPSAAAEGLLAGLITPRRRLGVTAQPVPLPAIWAGYLAPGQTAALLLMEVEPGSTASAIGLLPGDILLQAGGRPLADGAALLRVLAEIPEETPLALRVLRAGTLLEFSAWPRAAEQMQQAA